MYSTPHDPTQRRKPARAQGRVGLVWGYVRRRLSDSRPVLVAEWLVSSTLVGSQ